MARIAIIADDLTGASDTGVQFAHKGLRTRVLFDPWAPPGAVAGIEAAAIDTDSRAVSPAEANERVRAAASSAREWGCEHVFKKVDSTLRGNLGQEIEGIMAELNFDLAVVAPAFPKLGRTTVDGRHLLHGRPLEETEIARDPKTPVRESRIEELIRKQTTRPTGRIDLRVLRAGRDAVLQALESQRECGAQVIVFDAVEDADLVQIAEAVAFSPYRVLWVGSAGLADCLPRALGLKGQLEPESPCDTGGLPVVVVAGSISPTTRAQVASLRQEPGLVVVELEPLAIVRSPAEARAELDRCTAELARALADGLDVALVSATAEHEVAGARELGARLGADGRAVANQIAEALGAVAAGAIAHHHVGGLILTGGDTAKAVCRQLGVSGLEVLRELETGVPLSRLAGGRNLLTVTKAGAFGSEATLVRALRSLKGER
ncbi:MAG TPA: four-carbon acid sugar kinase family protein [Symbiobacteriaceae bacterium]|nr:four-carbon acid sugar kinase family protein [Symbiobacteriaceae bacterium]